MNPTPWLKWHALKLEFHDADTDTDIFARILADTSDTRDFLKLFLWQAERHADIHDDPREDFGEDVGVGVGVVECQLITGELYETRCQRPEFPKHEWLRAGYRGKDLQRYSKPPLHQLASPTEFETVPPKNWGLLHCMYSEITNLTTSFNDFVFMLGVTVFGLIRLKLQPELRPRRAGGVSP